MYQEMINPTRPEMKKLEEDIKQAMESLHVSEKDSRVYSKYINGHKHKGWRWSIIRLSDGMTKTGFVKEAE